MTGTIIVGFDGSAESRAAADWAAREARLRGSAVKLVHVWQSMPEPMGEGLLTTAETLRHWAERIPREAASRLRERHPGVEVGLEHVDDASAQGLLEAARDADLLVLGSRALSGVGGFLVGSVGRAVVSRAELPVVLVRAGEKAADEHVEDAQGAPSAESRFRPVVLGLDAGHPDGTLLAFAFEEALRRDAALVVSSSWYLPPYAVYDLTAGVSPRDDLAREAAEELSEALRPWREKYPQAEVVEVCRLGSPADHLVDASREASLVVVGRRIRRNPLGTHIGSVTQAVLHHATAPVAVVAHD